MWIWNKSNVDKTEQNEAWIQDRTFSSVLRWATTQRRFLEIPVFRRCRKVTWAQAERDTTQLTSLSIALSINHLPPSLLLLPWSWVFPLASHKLLLTFLWCFAVASNIPKVKVQEESGRRKQLQAPLPGLDAPPPITALLLQECGHHLWTLDTKQG